MHLIRGIAVSPGIVIGRAFLLGEVEQHVPHRSIQPADVPVELGRLDAALTAAIDDLVALRDRTNTQLGSEAAKSSSSTLGF